MELFAKIRRDASVEGASIRGLAKRYQIGRDTVRQALSDPLPPARKTPVRSSPRLDAFKHSIDAMLTEDTTAPPSSVILPAGSWPGSWRSTERTSCRIRPCVTTCGSVGRRSMWMPAAGLRCSFRRNTRRARRRRWISTNLATWNWIAAAPNSSSRSSPSLPGPHRARGKELHRDRLQRVILRLDQNLHRPAPLRRDR